MNGILDARLDAFSARRERGRRERVETGGSVAYLPAARGRSRTGLLRTRLRGTPIWIPLLTRICTLSLTVFEEVGLRQRGVVCR